MKKDRRRVSLRWAAFVCANALGILSGRGSPAADVPQEPGAAAADATRDRESLLGTWRFEELQTFERVVKADPERPTTLEFRAETLVRTADGQESVLRYTLDPSSTPKQMDWITEQDGRRSVSARIYELEGDTLRMCYGRGARPAGFKPAEDVTIVTFRRVKVDPAQAQARERQLDLQLSAGAAVFARDDVIKELDLTAAQQTQVRAVISKAAAEHNDLVARARDEQDAGKRRELIERAAEVRAAAKKRARDEVLTDEQRKRWEALLGAPATEREVREYQARKAKTEGAAQRGGALPEVPRLADVRRIAPGDRPTAEEQAHALWMYATRAHAVTGRGYVILTDHSEEPFLEPLKRLAESRHGTVVLAGDLDVLYRDRPALEELQDRLRALAPRYVAIAPRPDTFQENTLLCVWELLAGLDPDAQLDALPGFLIAPDATALQRLVDNTLAYAPGPADRRAFGLCQVTHEDAGARSLQKVLMLERELGSGIEMDYVAVGPPDVLPAAGPRESASRSWVVPQSAGFVERLPAPAAAALERSRLFVLFGHGVPGMVCGVEIAGLADVDLAGKVVLSGCCFAGIGAESDLPLPARGPDGSSVFADRPRFVLTAVDRGAVLAYGHMRLSNGFPSVAPLLEGLREGQSAGEAYQRLINAVLEYDEFEPVYAEPAAVADSERVKRLERRLNPFLHVLAGDPALVPFPAERN
jgi:uncharacterized protein (TIGR03067 family)